MILSGPQIPKLFKNKFLRLLFPVILFFLMCGAAHIRACADEETFFYCNRFIVNRGVIDNISGDGKAQKDLRRFIDSFAEGVNALSDGRVDEARLHLLKAREIWPEFFGTDFLLALVYEDSGDFRTAARYYKSYLNKLKAFHAGYYRISGPLIRSLMSFDIESYDDARQFVKERLRWYDIRLESVLPVITPPPFLFFLIFAAVLVAVYFVVYFWLVPYLKRQHRIKNPPEGFWICPHCGTANSELNKVCQECDRSRE